MAGRGSAELELGEKLEAITAVQNSILARLEGAREALSPPGLAQAREEVSGVVEELSHSAVLLGRVKKDLDSIFLRLRTLKRSLQAAFPQHAAAVEGGAAGGAAMAAGGAARQQATTASAEAKAALPVERDMPAAPGQQQQQQQEHQSQATAGAAGTVLDSGPPPH